MDCNPHEAASDEGVQPIESLTPREREIAVLVACGHSNRRIAEELVIARSTAERHIANILAKLNVRSRAEIAVWAVQHRLARAPGGARNERSWSIPDDRALLRHGHTNLPAELNSFVGRDRELRELSAILSSARLLTLTGSGGIGKTRLALRVAANSAANYQDGVWLVRLDALADPELVEAAVAAVLDVREQPGRALFDSITDDIAPRHLLLVLDNCEHLVEISSALAQALLQACPHLQLLATSREALNVAGECAWPVPSLSLPERQHAATAEQLTNYEAVRLFVDRASSARPDFVVTNQNAPAVAEVCRRLDGIPLAIELAAGRVKALPVEQLAQHLEGGFRLLAGGSRMAMPRQQTLRATIDWSYELLGASERVLFRRFAVFSGGWTLEAAEVVCAGQGLASEQILDSLCSLVDRSLVIADAHDGAGRYRLLETIRHYATERLEASGEADAVQRQHAEHFLRFAEQARAEMRGAGQVRCLAQLEVEHENLRAALRWYMDRGRAEEGLRFGGALWRFWFMRGHLHEGRERLTEVLELTEMTAPSRVLMAARAATLNGAGVLAAYHNDPVAARSLIEESLAIARQLGDRRAIASSLNNLGAIVGPLGDYKFARSLYQESGAIWRELGDQAGINNSLINLGNVVGKDGDRVLARALLKESLTTMRELGNQQGIASALNCLGVLARQEGDNAVARSLHQESLETWQELGHRLFIADTLNHLGQAAHGQGDYEAARAAFEEGLMMAREVENEPSVAAALEGLAGLAAADGETTRALRLAGAAARLRETIGAPLPPAEQESLQRTLQPARDGLGEPAAAKAWVDGHTMSVDQALARNDELATRRGALGPTNN